MAERWMSGVLDGVEGPAEIDIVREMGREEARKRLNDHRESFITEDDFKWLKEAGFDFVRLPVGYWLFEETDDFIDGEVYLRRAFRWAKKYGIGVVLDFHGLQGSQNGKDHSGQAGPIGLFRANNTEKALQTMEYMARTYGREPMLLGIEVINEPKFGLFPGNLVHYYEKAYLIVDKYADPRVKVIVSDAFWPRRMARKLTKGDFGPRLVLDIHIYQIFGWCDRLRSFDGHVRRIERVWRKRLQQINRNIPVMVGEWSAALPARAYRRIASGELVRAREYYKAQLSTYHSTTWAECYWTYKAPNCGLWDWQSSHTFLEK